MYHQTLQGQANIYLLNINNGIKVNIRDNRTKSLTFLNISIPKFETILLIVLLLSLLLWVSKRRFGDLYFYLQRLLRCLLRKEQKYSSILCFDLVVCFHKIYLQNLNYPN